MSTRRITPRSSGRSSRAAELDIRWQADWFSVATSTSDLRWQPSPELRRWVRLAPITLFSGAFVGFIGATLRAGWVAFVAFFAIILYCYCHLGVVGRLADESGLDSRERERLGSRLRWFGPAGLLELALRIREASGGH